MRVLDLGCGRAASSVFLRRELGVEVWAAGLWNDPTANLGRIREAGVDGGVHPLKLDARGRTLGYVRVAATALRPSA